MRLKVLWLFKVLGALLCALLFWEGVLRLAIIRPIAYRADPRLGWMPQSNARGLHSGEGFSLLRYNAAGFRDAEISARKPGETRILALGDSFTEGRQVDEQSTFARRLNALLRDCGDIRVFNGGRDGSSPAYSVYFADQYHRIFAPDWVLLLVRDGNWQQELEPGKEVSLRPDGDHFEFQTRWNHATNGRLDKIGLRPVLPDYARIRLSLLRGAAEQDYRTGGLNTASAEVLARQKSVMRWTLQQLKKQFPRLLVVHIPYGSSQRGDLVPPQPLEQALQANCVAQKIPFLALRGPIEADFVRTHQPPYGFANTLPWTGHPNGHGHQIIARELAKYFGPRLCTPATMPKNR